MCDMACYILPLLSVTLAIYSCYVNYFWDKSICFDGFFRVYQSLHQFSEHNKQYRAIHDTLEIQNMSANT